MKRVLTLAGVLAMLPFGASLAARSPGDVPEVTQGLMAVFAGDMIQEQCADISPRLLRVLSLRSALISAAKEAGFSDAEIDAFADDPEARRSLEADARRYLAARGVVPEDAATLCAVGQREIEAGTVVGRLLRAR
ncbi:MAG: DUF5333 domain-containing protein [Pseudomonadota bacterium]